MSEKISPQKSFLFEIANDLANDHNGHFVETHPRFNLALNDSIDVLVNDEDANTRLRFLITHEGPEAKSLYNKLDDAGITQFVRHTLANDVVMYSLPGQVKPLAHERLFIGHVSSETYISDTEQFTQLGKLWSSIYNAAEALPLKPLKSTAIHDFEQIERSLVPVPPYNWAKLGSSNEALSFFITNVGQELQMSNPGVPNKSLLEAVQTGWQLNEQS